LVIAIASTPYIGCQGFDVHIECCSGKGKYSHDPKKTFPVLGKAGQAARKVRHAAALKINFQLLTGPEAGFKPARYQARTRI